MAENKTEKNAVKNIFIKEKKINLNHDFTT